MTAFFLFLVMPCVVGARAACYVNGNEDSPMFSTTRPAGPSDAREGSDPASASTSMVALSPLRRPAAAAAVTAVVWIVSALPFAFGLVSCPTAEYLHFACPGCGMTRAMKLLASGEIAASLSMHALALPTALSQIALAIATVIAAARWGAPWMLWRARWGKGAIAFVALVFLLDLVLWGARAAGAFGGPVPV